LCHLRKRSEVKIGAQRVTLSSNIKFKVREEGNTEAQRHGGAQRVTLSSSTLSLKSEKKETQREALPSLFIAFPSLLLCASVFNS
jgi:hypothetical protein